MSSIFSRTPGMADPLFETDDNMTRVFAFLDKHLRQAREG